MPRQSDVARYGMVLALVVLVGLSFQLSVSAQSEGSFVPVTDAMLQSPSDDDWLMWRRTFNGWGSVSYTHLTLPTIYSV